jgi:hypothetical protein
MSITLPEDLSQQLVALARQQNRTPEDLVRDWLEQTLPASEHKPRIPGLHKGSTIYMSEDFDDHLGDDFWLGDE